MKLSVKQKGFTIVELLIVIVVIAVLAAISVVAYNGIQVRAENTKTLNSVTAYAKAITAYAAENSIYPVPAYNFPCLGDVPYCANMTDTQGSCSGAGRAAGSSGLNNVLATIVTTLPAPSAQTMDCNGKQYSGAYYAYTNSGKGATIRFYQKGDAECPSLAGLPASQRYQQSQTTSCNISFPLLP